MLLWISDSAPNQSSGAYMLGNAPDNRQVEKLSMTTSCVEAGVLVNLNDLKMNWEVCDNRQVSRSFDDTSEYEKDYGILDHFNFHRHRHHR